MIYLVALTAKNPLVANAPCWKCRSPLLAPACMRRVSRSMDAVLFTCPPCLPPDQAGNALLTISIADEAIARGLDLALLQVARKG